MEINIRHLLGLPLAYWVSGCCGTHMAGCPTLILGVSVIPTLDLLFQPLTPVH